MNLLEVRDLHVDYGGIRAVKGISFEVGKGELVCLIGANGAGKSSTLRGLSGLVAARGAVHYAGRELTGVPTFERSRAGLVLVPEGRGIFPLLNVDENLGMGAYARKDDAIETDRERVFSLFPRLAERRWQAGGTLSGGEQQMLAIGRALMSRPQLLLLDEPSMGLAPLIVQTIFAVIRKINAEGVAVLLSSRTRAPHCNWPAVPTSWTAAQSRCPVMRRRCWGTPRSKRRTWERHDK